MKSRVIQTVFTVIMITTLAGTLLATFDYTTPKTCHKLLLIYYDMLNIAIIN